MEKERAAGVLSPCSGLLQRVPLEENRSTTGPTWDRVGEGRREHSANTKDAKKADIESKMGRGAQKQA